MSVEHLWNLTDQQGKTEVLGEKLIPVPLCPPQIQHGIVWNWARIFMVTGGHLTAWAIPWLSYWL
jgi:hypothetical protein